MRDIRRKYNQLCQELADKLLAQAVEEGISYLLNEESKGIAGEMTLQYGKRFYEMAKRHFIEVLEALDEGLTVEEILELFKD